MKTNLSVTYIALRDMNACADYDKGLFRFKDGEQWIYERWYVSEKDLRTKEVYRLNRQLGLHKINKQR